MDLKQPALGIAAAIFVIGISLGICLGISPAVLGSWVALFTVAMVPPQSVLTLALQSQHPASIAKLPQPARGLVFVLLTAVVGAAIALAANAIFGGGMTPPTPFVILYLIPVVPVVLFLIIPLQCWPFSVMFPKKPLLMGTSVLAASLLITALFYYKLCNFDFLAPAPFYREELNPKGPMPIFVPMIFSFTMFIGIQFLILLDFWPICKIPPAVPFLGKQPWFGILALAFSAAVAWVMWVVFPGMLKMDLLMYQAVSVSMIYGMFILIVLMEVVPSLKMAQPGRGFVLIALGAVLAVAGFFLHKYLAENTLGLKVGPPGFDVEGWICSAMLAVTFPLMVTYASFFGFFPLKKEAQKG
jgi:hypothetical protein